jgi:hypothetical protein
MRHLKKKLVTGILGGFVLLSALAGLGAAVSAQPAEHTATSKVNEYEGQHRISDSGGYVVARKVNEYEGQHR